MVLGNGIVGLMGEIDIGLLDKMDVDIGGFCDGLLVLGGFGWIVIMLGFCVNVDDIKGFMGVFLDELVFGVDFFGGLKGLVFICFISLDCLLNVVCLGDF